MIDISNVNDTTVYIDAAGNKIAQFGYDNLTINKDNAGNNTVKQEKISFKIISADANVTVNNQFQISGVSSIQLIKGTVTIGDKNIFVADNVDGVTIGIENNVVTSITNLKDGGKVEYKGGTYSRNGVDIIKVRQCYG